MNKTYRVAMLGCGGRGRAHTNGFMQTRDRTALVALCDKDTDRLKARAEECGVTATYTDGDEMLEREKPDIFCFSTLPQIRLPVIEMGIRHHVPMIIYEKPMALTLAEAARIDRLTRDAGIKTVVSHQHKYGQHWQKVRELVAGGDIGQVHTIHATSKGWHLQYATHLIDYILFLNGPEHRGEWVIGQSDGGHFDDTHPSPDYTFGQIQFANGVRGIVECGSLAPDQPHDQPFWFNAGATVYGSAGYARVVVGYGWEARTQRSRGERVYGEGGFNDTLDQPPFILDAAAWLDDDAQVHPCNGDITYHGFELTMGILWSSLEGRRIDVPVDQPELAPDIIGKLREKMAART